MFIKIIGSEVVARSENPVYEDGWIEYNGELFDFNKYENGVVVEDTATKKLAEDQKKKKTGVPYELGGIVYLVPIDKEAQEAVTAVTVAVMANAFQSTVIEFSNGVRMPITSTEWMVFATWFANERNKLFV